MHLTVGTAIGAVNIVEDGGCVERMIDGRVINLPYLVACRDLDFGELPLPCLIGSLGSAVEVPVGDLCAQVGLGAVYACCRQSHPDK